MIGEKTPCSCGNCNWTGAVEELGDGNGRTLYEIHHLAERIDGGDTVPCGECPECDALVYEDATQERTVRLLTCFADDLGRLFPIGSEPLKLSELSLKHLRSALSRAQAIVFRAEASP